MTRPFRAMLVALGIDNLGTGLLVPLVLVWLTGAVGLPLVQATAFLTLGTVVGVLAPASGARVVDRVGARTVVVASQLLQGLGMVAYLTAAVAAPVVRPALALAGALLAASGTQLFYSALSSMTKDTAGASSDTAFAQVGRVRSLCFGAGALVGGLALTAPGTRWQAGAIAVDVVSFAVAALVLARQVPSVVHEREAPTDGGPARVLHDRPFLVLLATCFALMVSVELFLLTVPLYAHDRLGVPGWAVGGTVTLLTVVGVVLSPRLVAVTAGLTRTTCLAVGGVGLAVWCLLLAALPHVPDAARAGYLLANAIVFCVASGVVGPRLPALVGAIAPAHRSGAYYAYFQYAFTAAALAGPLVTALIDWRLDAPWLVGAAVSLAGVGGAGWLARSLPAAANTQT